MAPKKKSSWFAGLVAGEHEEDSSPWTPNEDLVRSKFEHYDTNNSGTLDESEVMALAQVNHKQREGVERDTTRDRARERQEGRQSERGQGRLGDRELCCCVCLTSGVAMCVLDIGWRAVHQF
jgi:hypothetical protein